jgi:hypothetical protein
MRNFWNRDVENKFGGQIQYTFVRVSQNGVHIFVFRLLDAHLLRVATIASRTTTGAAPAPRWVLLAGTILVSVVSIPYGPSHINLTRNMFQVSVSFLIICQPLV